MPSAMPSMSSAMSSAMSSMPSMPSQNDSPSWSRSPYNTSRTKRLTYRNPAGMHPVSWLLPPRYRYSKLVSLPSSDGIEPLNWFPQRDSAVRLASLPKDAGIDPDNWLFERPSHVRLVRLPSSGGIDPLNWLISSSKTFRLVSLPSSEGIEPLNWLSQRDSAVTRPLASVVTPCHWPMGASLSQLVLFVQLGPLVALYSAINTARSEGGGASSSCPSSSSSGVSSPKKAHRGQSSSVALRAGWSPADTTNSTEAMPASMRKAESI